MLKTYKESMGVKIKDYTEPTEEAEEILEEVDEEKKEELDEEGKKILDGIQKKVSDTLENIDEVEKRSKEALKEIMEETENE
jgi:hypothetical protein